MNDKKTSPQRRCFLYSMMMCLCIGDIIECIGQCRSIAICCLECRDGRMDSGQDAILTDFTCISTIFPLYECDRRVECSLWCECIRKVCKDIGICCTSHETCTITRDADSKICRRDGSWCIYSCHSGDLQCRIISCIGSFEILDEEFITCRECIAHILCDGRYDCRAQWECTCTTDSDDAWIDGKIYSRVSGVDMLIDVLGKDAQYRWYSDSDCSDDDFVVHSDSKRKIKVFFDRTIDYSIFIFFVKLFVTFFFVCVKLFLLVDWARGSYGHDPCNNISSYVLII